MGRLLMKTHGTQFAALPLHKRRAYEAKAQQMAKDKQEACEDDVAEIQGEVKGLGSERHAGCICDAIGWLRTDHGRC